MDDSPIRAIRLLEEYFPGSLIGGKYRLEALVGRGGMGSVWRASNVVLDMPVAIKLIRPEVRGDETAKLLLNEARLAAKLQHPSVVRLFDFGVAETGDAYIVMELLRGPSLADLLERHGKLSAMAAVRLLLPVVHGLATAHRTGVVHLDLKPENIVISEVGMRRQPKLLDFGIARKMSLRHSATASDTLIGSPAYMSPEQASGSRDIDARADVWGICVVLYELVSGRGPFTAETASETLNAVMQDEPTPLDAGDSDARALWSIVRRGLAKDRQHRFSNARQLGDALASWLIERDEHHDVCGERLLSNWGPAAHARTAVGRLRSDTEKPAAKDAALPPAPAPKRWRTAWLLVAACLCVGAPALVLRYMAAVRQAHTGEIVAADGGISRHNNPTVHAGERTDHDGRARPSPEKQGEDANEQQVQATAAVATSTKHSSGPGEQRTARMTKLSTKRVHRAHSKEAELGLKDPFE